MALPDPSQLRRSLSQTPFSEQWELLKSTIQDLYIERKCPLSEVISTLKCDYGFDAREVEQHLGAVLTDRWRFLQ